MKPNVAALLAYVVGWITGLIFFIIEKDSQFVKFHAMQSIMFFGGLGVLSFVLMFIPILGWMVVVLLPAVSFIGWIVLMVKAFQGQWFRLPIIGDLAAKQVGIS